MREARVDAALEAERTALAVLDDVLQRIEVVERRRILREVEDAMDWLIAETAWGDN